MSVEIHYWSDKSIYTVDSIYCTYFRNSRVFPHMGKHGIKINISNLCTIYRNSINIRTVTKTGGFLFLNIVICSHFSNSTLPCTKQPFIPLRFHKMTPLVITKRAHIANTDHGPQINAYPASRRCRATRDILTSSALLYRAKVLELISFLTTHKFHPPHNLIGRYRIRCSFTKKISLDLSIPPEVAQASFLTRSYLIRKLRRGQVRKEMKI